MAEDTRTVVLTRKGKWSKDYINAVVHPDPEAAAAGLAEAEAAAPWFTHSTVSLADFAATAEGSE